MATFPIHRIAVIGTGTVGASWSALFLAHGLTVLAWDPAPGAATRLREHLRQTLPILRELGLKGEGELQMATTPEAAAQTADFVQENAPETVDLKVSLLGRLDAASPPQTLIASSTSALRLSEINSACQHHPERVIVAHPFNPPHLIPLVELTGAPVARQRAAAFYRQIGKYPVCLQREMTGHIANRLSSALWREALYLLQEGVASVADIDAALSQGPGLRWAFLGQFMIYHLGGGEGGIGHHLEHLGESQLRRWASLGEPRWDENLKQRIREGVAAASDRDIAELAAERDRKLLQLLALKDKA